MIDDTLVCKLVATQFPHWKDLSVRRVEPGGWDNRTFRLGKDMLVRLPSGAEYAPKVDKEQLWLPKLAPLLPLPIPVPLALGEPTDTYPWKWSIYRWIEGETIAAAPPNDLCSIAAHLSEFLLALQAIDSAGGPRPGPTVTSRGGPLNIYDDQTREALSILKDQIDIQTATRVWEEALATPWSRPPVWVHGDVSAGNLLVRDGQLSAVIDFGGLVVGDPACDLAIAWTLFEGESRQRFRAKLPLDEGTWARGRGWTLWKALIIAAGLTETNAVESARPWQIIDEVLNDLA